MNKGIKRVKRILVSATLVAALAVPVFATSASAAEKGYISFGENLSDDQKAVVLEGLGVTADELEEYSIVYVSNKEEHELLGDYIPAAQIGNKALSSVKLTEGSDGINVTTHNINYCTTGMYSNALATAGAKNVDVVVAAPFEISGTAALIGAVKAYEEMSGEQVDEEVIEGAVEEMVVTGKIEDSSSADDETIEGMIAYMKEEIANGNGEDVDALIEEAQNKFSITLTDEEIALIKQLLEKLSKLDLDADVIAKQAQNVYGKLKDMGIDLNLDDINTDTAKGLLQKILDFIRSILNR